MSPVTGNAARGLPALIGVLWGIYLYTPDWSRFWYPFVTLVVARIFLGLGRAAMGRWPLLGWMLIELWIVAAISVMALGTVAVLWLTVNSPNWFPLDEPERKAISGALVGAVTTYIAVLWTKEIQDGSGPFWPGTQFRSAVRSAFADPARVPKGDTRARDAIDEDRVREGLEGWGLSARLQRARILGDHLKGLERGAPAG
jgi:hypothetical protein